jgi:hypothetical protein
MTHKKINSTLALVLLACVGFAQNSDTLTKSKLEERKPIKVSFLSNYYGQDGDRGATGGGIGSQELYSYTNEGSIFLPLNKKTDLKLNGGVDHFTAASYLDIDKYKTSASSGSSGVSVDETRKYGGISLDLKNAADTKISSPYFGISNEYDVKSYTFGFTQTYKNKEKGSSLTFKANSIMDRWLLIYPGEFRNSELNGATGASDKGTKIAVNAEGISLGAKTATKDGKTYGLDYRYSNAIGGSYAFNINKKMNGLIGVDGILQKGLLSTPFYRVYFRDGVTDEYTKEVKIEKLPESRLKFAFYGRYNAFISNKIVLRTSARLYTDSWGVNSATLDLCLPIKITKGFSIAPFYRIYAQTQAKYFAGYGRHELNEEFYTSDFDLANLSSNRLGATLRLVPFRDFINIKSVDLRMATYKRSDGLTANSLTAEVHLEF